MTPLRAAFGKSKNRRIRIETFLNNDNEFTAFVHTKRLVGKWQDRDIAESRVAYGMYTFRMIYEIMKFMFNDVEFQILTEQDYDELKENVMVVQTDIKSAK